jgi:hypothetical protein
MDMLVECITSLKEKGQKVLLTSHYPISDTIKNLVDYTVYDGENQVLRSKDYLHYDVTFFFWMNYANYRLIQSYPYNHSFAVWTLMRNGFAMASALGYKNAHVVDYDCVIGEKKYFDDVNRFLENQEAVSLTWHKLQELSDYDFNSIVEGLLQNRTDAKNKIKMMAEEAIEELREEGSDEALGVYGGDEEEDEEGDVATPEAGEEKEGEYTDPVLKKLLGGDEEEDEGPQETGNLEDMSKDQLVKLMQSAIEDEDYEFASQIRDILNNR